MQQIINTFSTASLYALIAVGYAMIFSVLRLIHFCHADVMMLGAYIGFWMSSGFRAPLWAQLLAAVVICAAAGMLIERLIYFPIRSRCEASGKPLPQTQLMTAAIGVSIVLQYGVMLLATAQPRAYPTSQMADVVQIGDAAVSGTRLIILGLSLLVLISFAWILRRTRFGLSIRALADDPMAARLCGISVDRAVRQTFALSSAAAAVGGVLYGQAYLITPLMGGLLGMKAYVCTMIGGKKSGISGVVLGAFLLSTIETMVCLTIGSRYKDMAAFVILILLLLFRREK